MDDGDAVAPPPERVREAVDVERVAAEVVRRVEGRDHAEGARVSHRSPPGAAAREPARLVLGQRGAAGSEEILRYPPLEMSQVGRAAAIALAPHLRPAGHVNQIHLNLERFVS